MTHAQRRLLGQVYQRHRKGHDTTVQGNAIQVARRLAAKGLLIRIQNPDAPLGPAVYRITPEGIVALKAQWRRQQVKHH